MDGDSAQGFLLCHCCSVSGPSGLCQKAQSALNANKESNYYAKMTGGEHREACWTRSTAAQKMWRGLINRTAFHGLSIGNHVQLKLSIISWFISGFLMCCLDG